MNPREDGSAVPPGPGLAICVVSISTAAILIRLTSADPLAVAAYRLTISVLVIAPFSLRWGLGDLLHAGRRDAGLLILTGSALALHFALWITSLYHTTVAASVLLVTTSPVFIALADRFIFRSSVSPRAVLGIAIAMSGVAVVALPGGRVSGDLGGMLMALGGAVAVSAYLIGGRHLRQRLPLLPYVLAVYTVASLELIGACMVGGVRLTGFGLADYGFFLLLGIVPSHFGHTLYNYLLRFLDAKVVAVSTLGEPILSSLWAFLLLNEIPGIFLFAGAPLVLLGIYLTATGARPRRPGLPPAGDPSGP